MSYNNEEVVFPAGGYCSHGGSCSESPTIFDSSDATPSRIHSESPTSFNSVEAPPSGNESPTSFKSFEALRSTICNESYSSLKSMRVPLSRILFLQDGLWTDFPAKVSESLKAAFQASKTSVEVSFNGERFCFDFAQQKQISLDNGSQNSIAWIDVKDQCFFPKLAIDSGSRNDLNLATVRKAEEPDDRTSETTPTPESLSPSRSRKDLTCPVEEQSVESAFRGENQEGHGWSGTSLLEEGNKNYEIIKQLFCDGMRNFALNATITSIHKCMYTNRARRCRVKAFEAQLQALQTARGNANVMFAWYGASGRSISDVVEHGFGQPNHMLLGPNAHGIGIHLSPLHSPYTSSLLSEAEDDGQLHVVFCRVIMGKVEEVPAGSRQFHPSSSEFDNGVDNRKNPKWFVVWTTNMNMHILPEYVVSFKLSTPVQAPMLTSSARKLPSTVTFPKLFAVMKRSLTSQQMQEVERLYNQHKVGKTNRHTFIVQLRIIVGDPILRSSIKRMEGRM